VSGFGPRAFLAQGKLAIPALAIGADHSYGTVQADDLRHVAVNVTSAVIANSGHWIMEEQPGQAVRVIAAFVDEQAAGEKH
jgi:pimeloyl-ACP methyl ester carboxylesterase